MSGERDSARAIAVALEQELAEVRARVLAIAYSVSEESGNPAIWPGIAAQLRRVFGADDA